MLEEALKKKPSKKKSLSKSPNAATENKKRITSPALKKAPKIATKNNVSHIEKEKTKISKNRDNENRNVFSVVDTILAKSTTMPSLKKNKSEHNTAKTQSNGKTLAFLLSFIILKYRLVPS